MPGNAGTVLATPRAMQALRVDRGVLPRDGRVALREGLRKQIQRTVISVDGVPHRLRIVDILRGTDPSRQTVVITITTDNSKACAHVHISRDRLEYPEFVVSLLAYAMRALIKGELAPDGVEAL